MSVFVPQKDSDSIKKVDSLADSSPEPFDLANGLPSRPPMVYSSPGDFLKSFARRWKTNATEEFFVRKRPLYEVVGQLGMYGTLINGIQAASLEHNGMKMASWNSMTIGLLVAYTGGLFLYHYHPYWLYFVAFVIILGGLITYFWYSTRAYISSTPMTECLAHLRHIYSAEEQGDTNPVAPSYVNTRGQSEESAITGTNAV
ncbi:hypothetical protein H0H81_009982 [Sphagnurus paluster]|uniref:Uncharacterized protein n=1 Tax=Sphagnurus paluster TaxID=117069 RepID=A0A9P7GI72_9AGAR|nr:hypothetical protein H0H81_009982 [Sphagnurus paluster]